MFGSWLWVASGCGESGFESTADGGYCEGHERCACYGNGTCDEGLSCLSEHCVRLAANDDGGESAAPSGDDEAVADEAVSEEASAEDEHPGAGDDIASDDDSNPAKDDSVAPSADDAMQDDGMGSPGEDSEPSDGEPNTTEPQNTEPQNTEPSAADDASDDVSEPDDSDAEPPENTDATGDMSVDPTETEPPPSESTPDEPPETTLPEDCEIALDPDHVCRARAACSSANCSVFEYVWAVDTQGALVADAGRSLSLQDVSNDGLTVLGTYREKGVTIDAGNAFVWYWGEEAIHLLASSDGSAPVAINGDGSVVVGHDIACDSECTYSPTRWTHGEPEPLPSAAPVPYSISDGNVVIGYTRVGEVLQSFVWSGGEPALVDGTALMVLDAAATRALGLNDDGEVVLWQESGSRFMPAGPNNFDPQYPTAFNRNGTLAIGQGWDGSHEGWFLWEIDTDTVSVVTPPLAGYDGVMPTDIDEEGQIVVGQCLDMAHLDQIRSATIAFYWDAEAGMRSFEDELESRGVLLPEGVRLQSASLSHDGQLAFGSGFVSGTPILWRAWLGRL